MKSNLPNVLNFTVVDDKKENVKEEIEDTEIADSDEKVDNETGESNPNFIYDDEQEDSELPVVALPIRKKPVKKDIFADVELNKKGRPKKKLSDEHLAKLQKARHEAQERKRLLKQEKAEMSSIENKKKALLKKREEIQLKKEAKRLEKLEQKVDNDELSQSESESEEEEKPVKRKSKKQSPNPLNTPLTIEDLQQAQMNTLLTYEKMRKQRKAEKKSKQQEQQYAQQTMNAINKGWQGTAGQYSNCY